MAAVADSTGISTASESAAAAPRQITIETSDKQLITVDRDVIAMSTTINTMLHDLGLDDNDKPVEAIPVSNVSALVMKKVLEWCERHKGEKYVEDPEKSSDNISEWDKEFMKLDQSTIFDIILAANFLDIKGLLDVGCKTVAGMIKGKKPEEIRRVFNIQNDLTPEEEEQIRKENAWCEE